MGIIRKVHPTDIDLIEHLYGLITGLGKMEYKYLTFDKFMECRDSIYIYIDKCYEFSQYPKIDGFIACRRTNMEDIDIDKLLYYPQPHHILYSIEGFYIFQCNTNEKRHDVIKQLLNVIEIDKNDSFIAVKFFDEHGNPPDDDLLKELISHRYYFNKYNRGIHTFVKVPTTLINRSI